MSSFVTVVHAARQYKIQCNPAKILNDVLVEACDKANVDADSHGLRHGKNNLDLSQSFRIAHLPGGAKLDLVRVNSHSESTVNVALNVPNTPRKTALISPSSSLWEALVLFEQQHAMNILNVLQAKDGQMYQQQVVLQLMNREYSTNEQLQRTTLASLGIKGGSAVFRISFRHMTAMDDSSSQSGTNEANPQPQVPPNGESRPHSTNSNASTGAAGTLKSITQEYRTLVAPSLSPVPSPIISRREVEVLLPSRTNTPHHSASTGPDDDHLEMSVTQAKAYQASLMNKSQPSQPLLTQRYRDQQAMEKRLKSKPEQCRVKFRFPDGTQVIGTFKADETSCDLYAFARDVTVVNHDSEGEWTLEVLGDRKRIPRDDDTQELWRDLQFGKAMAVQVVGDVRVKEEFRGRGKDVGAFVAAQSGGAGERAACEPEGHDRARLEDDGTAGAGATRLTEPATAKKLPKWLQKSLGKK